MYLGADVWLGRYVNDWFEDWYCVVIPFFCMLTASLYLNNNLLGSTNTVISNTISNSIGYYYYTFNTLGNANYTANSLTANFSSYVPINIYYANTISSEIHKTLNTSGLYLFNPPQCTNNAANLSSGYCVGNMAYSASTTLSSDIYVFGNITIDSGVTLTENGFYMYATNTFDNLGEIKGGNNPNAPGGIGGNGGTGTSLPSSYAGSGGGGGSNGGCGGSGGSTLVSGGTAGCSGGVNTGSPGSTPSAPTMSQTLTNSMFNNIAKYLGSAAGGSSGGSSTVSGAGGVYGVIVRGKVVIAGTINTTGAVGQPGSDGGGGGSGGGVILILYNSSYTAGTYSYSGGLGGTSAGGNGGAGGNGQVITYNSPFTSPPPAKATYYYPLKYNASTTSNAINFNVSIFDYVTSSRTSLSSNQSFTYLPELATPYSLSFKEQQGTQKVYLNTTFILNTTTINSAFTFNSYNDGCIQYFPCLAETPTWTAKPTSWSIIPANEAVINQQSNTSKGEQFDSPNLAVNFANVIKLSYPFTSFYLNLTNNPKVQSSINQYPLSITLTNSLISSKRVINNYTIFSQETFNSVNTNLTVTLNATFNAYHILTTISNTTGSKYWLEMPISNYINPNMTYLENDSASTPLYYFHPDTYCPYTVSLTTNVMYSIGMVDTNGSKYNFYVYTSTGSQATGDIMQILEQKGNSATQVQSYLIPSAIPFTLPLEATGQSYAFNIYSKNCASQLFKGSLSVPSNPVYITINSSSTGYVYNVTKASGRCYLRNQTTLLDGISCYASDTTGLARNYSVDIWKSTSIVGGQILVYNAIFNGPDFIKNFTLPNNGIAYTYQMTLYDAQQPLNSGPLTKQIANLASPLIGLIAFIIMLVFILGGASTGRVTIMVMLTDVGLIIVGILIDIPTSVGAVFLVLSLLAIWWSKYG